MKLHARPSLASVGAILAVGIVSGIVVYLIFFGFRYRGWDLFLSIVMGLIYTITMWTTQQLAGMLAERRIPLVSRRDVALRVAIHSIAIALSFLLATAIIDLLFDPGWTKSGGTMTVIALVSLVGSLIGNGFMYLDAFHKRLRRAEQTAHTAQLDALRARINPHFLFNSLNSIAALIRTRPAEAESVTESLADLFRYSLRASEQPSVTLAEELASVELYLDIERARFRDRLRVKVDVPEQLRRVRVPSMILQPLVENAIKHGLGMSEGVCEITLRGVEEDGLVRIVVSDTGPGFASTDPATIFSSGHGLASVRDRLQHHPGGELRIGRNEVEIVIPRDGIGDVSEEQSR